MNKQPIDIEELIKELRYCATTTTCKNCYWASEHCLTDMKTKAADALEQLMRKEKFHAFLWDVIGPNEMEQYLSMYHAGEEKDNG